MKGIQINPLDPTGSAPTNGATNSNKHIRILSKKYPKLTANTSTPQSQPHSISLQYNIRYYKQLINNNIASEIQVGSDKDIVHTDFIAT